MDFLAAYSYNYEDAIYMKGKQLKYQKEVFRGFSMVLQFGINMIVPIVLCTFVGIFLDRLFSTSFIVIIMFFFGALAGFRNIFIFARNMNKRQTYLGSDADESVSGHAGEDFGEKMDRVYRDNMNE